MNPAMLVWLAFQQEPSPAILGVTLVAAVAVYAYLAFCFQKIAQRTNTENAWWAWVPILQALLMLKVAQKPMWWFVLFLVPFVNFIIAIVVLVAICQRLGKSGWLAVAMLIPVVNFVVIGYLAFAE